MWCAHCQADVATEISADGQSLRCTTCSHEIRRVFAPSLHPETQSARELLERWAREDQGLDEAAAATEAPETPVSPMNLDAAGHVLFETEPTETASQRSRQIATDDLSASHEDDPTDADAAGAAPTGGPRRGPAPKPYRPPVKLRVDSAHDSTPAPPAPKGTFGNKPGRPQKTVAGGNPTDPVREPQPPIDSASSTQRERPAAKTDRAAETIGATRSNADSGVTDPPTGTTASTESRGPHRRLDPGHPLQSVPAPHLDIAPFAPAPTGPKPGRSESLWGQLLAYAGVGVLTTGTVLVLWGYFGSIESYASTGWLVSTAGQMLLFLGVITLVSGGMQQASHEVGSRMETLDDRIHRIEKSTHQILKGPYYARRRRSRRKANRGEGPEAKSA
ncbi:MAG: hypothetical protein KDA58_08655 [Planctomycetaceae bacterium]|nr:hypothetical protein [Planctomycetaceae bacterium]